jgi:hypothetical protein
MDGGTMRLFWERVSKILNIGPYEDFKSAMGDPKRRKTFHTEISKSMNIGTFEEFEKRMLGDETPTIKTKTLTFDNTYVDKTPTKSCDKFPFELGCINTKIGDLNAKFFSGNRYNDTYNKQLENFLENKGYFSNSNNELTKETWDYLMNKNIIKESIKKVLKEYINKK